MELHIRKEGHAGRITLHRPKALNALSYQMCLDIEAALDDWRDDADVALVIIDAEGDKAFCAGGDIQKLYDTASAGDYEYGRKFWRDEYRLNAKIANFPKPYVALMQGFTMGGGVGVACHGSHRIVCENSQIAMPECGIGLVPDVGGSLLLARAPGRIGEYLGTTGTRMDAGNAIYSGFADYFIPRKNWESLIAKLVKTGDVSAVERAATPAPTASFQGQQSDIDCHFAWETIADVLDSLSQAGTEFSLKALSDLRKKSPISVSCTPIVIQRVRTRNTIEQALAEEYQFTYRAAEFGDFVEGIKGAIIDRTHTPVWKIPDLDSVTDSDVEKMLKPLGKNAL
ncbi:MULTISPECIES: enoyl-CoA hydratase/isomerase family protein [Rhodobacterales]|uniref:enoyl-CoA hydratase/isomerase family protein n=1 Tax=Roseobacter sp. N2S TaxID=2663844 RepID=UPI00285B8015|nr:MULTISPECIES: enoyl-CoA hydratase/isomerase family protein [Rhodobacterales]MDR6265441.1 enoyl-CoA hydratase/carnithine racemase [Roseobacter sp. N2S]